MTIDDETLMAYADGELSADERAAIERALADDPALRARLDSHHRLRAQLSGAYADVLNEPLPNRLVDAAQATTQRPASVVELNSRREGRARWSMREWGAMAASLAGGLIIGLGAMNAQAPPIAVTADGMSARGALSRALDTQLASDSSGAVRIGLSFRAQDGAYCRTFELTQRETAGIACREAGGWAVAMTAAQDQQGEVRMAGASEAVLNAVEAMIDGEPLNAEQEAQAREAGWQD